MEYFIVTDWQQHQHYRDRDPKWIKLHLWEVLDSYEFSQMPEVDQIHLLKIRLLFAKENPPSNTTIKPLPIDVKYISGRIASKKKVNLERLLKTSFLKKYTLSESERTDLERSGTDSGQPRTPYKQDTKEPYKKEEKEEGESQNPPHIFYKILKKCQAIRRVTYGIPDPFDDPKDAGAVQWLIDRGHSPKKIQVAFFLYCVSADPFLNGKPRTIPQFKYQVINYWKPADALLGGERFSQGYFDFKKQKQE